MKTNVTSLHLRHENTSVSGECAFSAVKNTDVTPVKLLAYIFFYRYRGIFVTHSLSVPFLHRPEIPNVFSFAPKLQNLTDAV